MTRTLGSEHFTDNRDPIEAGERRQGQFAGFTNPERVGHNIVVKQTGELGTEAE